MGSVVLPVVNALLEGETEKGLKKRAKKEANGGCCSDQANGPPKKLRNVIHWKLMNTFNSEQEMLKVRCTQRVSKRKTDIIKTGVKLTFRCNVWKRTRCTYQMYVLYNFEEQIELYETGTHNHDFNTKARFPNPPKTYLTPASKQYLDDLIENHKKGKSPSDGRGPSKGRKIKHDIVKKDEKVSTEEGANNDFEDILKKVVNNNEDSMEGPEDIAPTQFGSEELVNSMKFINMFSTYPQETTLTPNEPVSIVIKSGEDEANDTCSEGINEASPNSNISFASSSSSPTNQDTTLFSSKFSLNESECITQLIKIAQELDLQFIFRSGEAGGNELCLQQQKSNDIEKVVILADLGEYVQYEERENGGAVEIEKWLKADYTQFLWALRGKCCYFFRSISIKTCI
uniref:FLYWCH-type domain-containing protein n=1 Tax=Rhabditophanes sp. KR3021 TaxID=114890 RepID=A0AC35UFT2_9BILA